VMLAQNKWRQTNHYIVIAFFAVCASILSATAGKVSTLAGVYTISFLCVMSLFAIGNMLLKSKRARLPRETRAAWPVVVVALMAVLVGLVGNLLLDPENLRVFAIYFGAASAIVGVMFLRIQLMKLALFVSRAVVDRAMSFNSWIRQTVAKKIEQINSLKVVYFTKGSDPAELNRAALYVLENEQTNNLTVVHVYDDATGPPLALAEHLKMIDRLYPQLRIDFLAVRGIFGPDLIEALSQRLGVPKNYMFLGTPGDRFPHRLQELGGVRLVL